ncbi:MAG: M48 family metalloprotease [Burkholderiaceae bacterium]|nr:M48 family metalloprotease [Burkholderiaceae bacterium]
MPSLGDAGDMTPLEERKLGDLIVRDLYSDPAYMDDPILGDYVDGIWRRLLAVAEVRGNLTAELAQRYAWRLLLVRDREVNSFAMPGGYIGVNLGMIGVVDSRDELAAVLAHETSHIMQRHIARMIARQNREQPLLLAAMVAGILAGLRNPEIGAAAVAGGQATAVARQLHFSRNMEREADRIGYGVFVQAGFDPWGFVSMFEKLMAASRLNDNGDWPFLRDHPLTTERIADMQERQRSLQGRPKPAPDWEALLMAARARVLGEPGVDMLRGWARMPETTEFARLPPPQRAAALYAAALSQAALHNLPQAQSLAEQLAALTSGHAGAMRQTRLLQAELAVQARQPARALQLLPASAEAAAAQSAATGGTLEISDATNDASAMGGPGAGGGADPARVRFAGRAALLLRVQAQLQTGQRGQIDDAASSLRAWVSIHPDDALAWQRLAQANWALGQELRALRADGEAQMANLDYAGAIDRWRAAQDYSRKHQSAADDLIEGSIVDVRLRAAQEAFKRQKEEEKKYG